VGVSGITNHHDSPWAGGLELYQLCGTKMELFITVKCRHRFLRGSSELAVSCTEALQPAFNWVVHWLFGCQLSKDIDLIVSDGNKSHSTTVANEYKHIV
jgi:hypothetical protein